MILPTHFIGNRLNTDWHEGFPYKNNRFWRPKCCQIFDVKIKDITALCFCSLPHHCRPSIPSDDRTGIRLCKRTCHHEFAVIKFSKHGELLDVLRPCTTHSTRGLQQLRDLRAGQSCFASCPLHPRMGRYTFVRSTASDHARSAAQAWVMAWGVESARRGETIVAAQARCTRQSQDDDAG